MHSNEIQNSVFFSGTAFHLVRIMFSLILLPYVDHFQSLLDSDDKDEIVNEALGQFEAFEW